MTRRTALEILAVSPVIAFAVHLAVAMTLHTPSAMAAGKAKPKATATPAAHFVPTPVPTPVEPAVASDPRPLNDGAVTYKLGKKDVKLGDVKGSIQSSGGYQIANVVFSGKKSERLQLDFMYSGTGPVESGYLTAVYASDDDGMTTAWKKNVSTCSVSLEKASPTMVEGTANCPKGMLAPDSKPGKPITEVKFRAESKP